MEEIKTALQNNVSSEQFLLSSQYLQREVMVNAYCNTSFLSTEPISLLLMNDGQDVLQFSFDILFQQLNSSTTLQPLLCIAIHSGKDRLNEYGTAYAADYKGRGAKAGLYSKFIFDELIPFVRKKYNQPIFKEKSFVGFSLGALSALDIVWNHANEFSKIGIFSASLWWRRKSYDDGYNDEIDRLMHLQIRHGGFYPWLKFYIQCGALDETADRNNNGIIDSIDDALDLIVELKAKGYTNEHIQYVLLQQGKHDIETWHNALPAFLEWGWGK